MSGSPHIITNTKESSRRRNKGPGGNNPKVNNLELTSTAELVSELLRRYDEAIFIGCGLQTTEINGQRPIGGKLVDVNTKFAPRAAPHDGTGGGTGDGSGTGGGELGTNGAAGVGGVLPGILTRLLAKLPGPRQVELTAVPLLGPLLGSDN